MLLLAISPTFDLLGRRCPIHLQAPLSHQLRCFTSPHTTRSTTFVTRIPGCPIHPWYTSSWNTWYQDVLTAKAYTPSMLYDYLLK